MTWMDAYTVGCPHKLSTHVSSVAHNVQHVLQVLRCGMVTRRPRVSLENRDTISPWQMDFFKYFWGNNLKTNLGAQSRNCTFYFSFQPNIHTFFRVCLMSFFHFLIIMKLTLLNFFIKQLHCTGMSTIVQKIFS